MTVRLEFAIWISKLWLVDINLKIMTIGLLDTNQTAVVRATIPAVRSSILTVWWLETSIWWWSSEPLLQQSAHRWWRYNSQRHQSAGSHQSHYFGSLSTRGVRQNHYFNNLPTGGSLFGGTVGGETNPAAFIRATILAVQPLDLHHKRLHWSSHWCW